MFSPEWVAWLCRAPFLFLFWISVGDALSSCYSGLIKLKTTGKKTPPPQGILCIPGGLWIWLDLPGSEIWYLFFKSCTNSPPRAVPGWDWQPNLNTNAALDWLPETRRSLWDRQGGGDCRFNGGRTISSSSVDILPFLTPMPFSPGLLASQLSILQGLMIQCEGENWQLKKKFQSLGFLSLYHFPVWFHCDVAGERSLGLLWLCCQGV